MFVVLPDNSDEIDSAAMTQAYHQLLVLCVVKQHEAQPSLSEQSWNAF